MSAIAKIRLLDFIKAVLWEVAVCFFYDYKLMLNLKKSLTRRAFIIAEGV